MMFREFVEKRRERLQFVVRSLTATLIVMAIFLAVMAGLVIKNFMFTGFSMLFLCAAAGFLMLQRMELKNLEQRAADMIAEAGEVSEAGMDALLAQSRAFGEIYLSDTLLLDLRRLRTYRRSGIKNVRLTQSSRNASTRGSRTYLSFSYENQDMPVMLTSGEDAQNRELYRELTGELAE
ncbi:MAG: hypothetical protein IK130_04440 [Oscillospiraceae bacterium]|nr:hypothetical protein [Oscillospiraceae bacterium]